MQGWKKQGSREATPLPVDERQSCRLQHQYFVPDYKSRSKSRFGSLMMEFLNRVFCSDGASRFFKTFLLRFMFDAQSGDDCSASLVPVAR